LSPRNGASALSERTALKTKSANLDQVGIATVAAALSNEASSLICPATVSTRVA